MVKIIETNLSVDGENNIKDHQAKLELINDWKDYCKKYQNYSGRRVYVVLRVVCLEQISQQMPK